MNPSVWNSTAGAAMALAKPVMGTRVPAPACLAMSSKRLRPVSSATMATRVMDAAPEASCFSSPRDVYQLMKTCPRVQMPPPTQNAHRQSRHTGERGESSLTN